MLRCNILPASLFFPIMIKLFSLQGKTDMSNINNLYAKRLLLILYA